MFVIANDQVVAVESRRFQAFEVCCQWRCEALAIVAVETRIFGLGWLHPAFAAGLINKKIPGK